MHCCFKKLYIPPTLLTYRWLFSQRSCVFCLGYSDYDFDIRSITDDTDDYAEIPDVIEELELIKPELKIRVENERRVSRSKIINLERELEGQQDYYRASEVAKDRQIKSLLRDIEGINEWTPIFE